MALTIPQIIAIMEEFPLPRGISWHPGGGTHFFQPYATGGAFRGEVTTYLIGEAPMDGAWKYREVKFYPPFESPEDVRAKIKRGVEELAS